MTTAEIIRNRLFNQYIAIPEFTDAPQVVAWLGAMQAQEFAMAKWAIGLRMKKATESTIDKAFNEGAILRTHLLRPTWHFVAPGDIRWLLALTSPRIHALSAYYYRQAELDTKMLRKTNELLAKMLEGGKYLTRAELQAGLEKKKIRSSGLRLGYIMMYAELEAVICSGPRKGKQFTYALLEERVAPAKNLTRHEALATLVLRYFSSRGPATLQDFVVWSGLTMKDARDGAATLPSSFHREKIVDKEYIFIPRDDNTGQKIQSTFLMPDYDEYGMGYKDRSAIFTPKEDRSENPIFNHSIVIDGKIAGTWQRSVIKDKVKAEAMPFIELSVNRQSQLQRAIKKYEKFFNQ
jgi:hypothetical protein